MLNMRNIERLGLYPIPGVKSGEPGSGLGSTSPEENIQSTRKPGYGLLQPYYSQRYPE